MSEAEKDRFGEHIRTFETLLMRQIGDFNASTEELRKSVYGATGNALHKRHERSDLQTEMFEVSAFNRAVTNLEANAAELGHQARIPSDKLAWHDRFMFRLIEFFKTLKGRYGAMAGALSTASDFIKPIGDFTLAFALAAPFFSLVFYAISRRNGKLQEHARAATSFCLALAICSVGWLALQNLIPGAKAKGAVAEVIPGATAVQNVILASLGRIEQNTERAASSAEQMEMVLRGGLQGAIETHDARFASRLLKGGWRISSLEIAIFVERQFNPEIAAIIVKHKSQIDRRICTEEFVPISPVYDPSGFLVQASFIRKLDTVEKRNFFFSICDKSEVMKLYLDKLSNLRQQDEQLPQRNAELQQKRQRCVDEFREKFMTKAIAANSKEGQSIANDAYSELWRREAATAGAENNPIRSEFLSRSRSAARSQIYADYLDGQNAATIVSRTIQAGCKEAHPDLSGDRDKIDRLQKAASVIAQQAGLAPLVFSQPVASSVPASLPTADQRSAVAVPRSVPSPLPQAQIAPASPPLVNPQPLVTAALEPTLAPSAVREQMMSRIVMHGNAVYAYFADGDMEVSINRDRPVKGTYRIESDGRVCWNSSQAKNCFEYYRRSGNLRVRRADASNRRDIGPVKVEGHVTPSVQP